MSSFRDQLGEDWLRYQHHLDRASPDIQPCTQTPPLPNGGNAATVPSLSPNTLNVLPPPRHMSETAVDPCDEVEDQETESTLQWPGHSPQPTESTLEDSVLDGLPLSQRRPRAESQELANGDSEDSKEDEEEEDLGGKSLATFSFLKTHEGDCGQELLWGGIQDWSILKVRCVDCRILTLLLLC